MVGLYKDPKGETITTMRTSNMIDSAVSDKNQAADAELKMLRCKVTELENELKKYVSVYS